ncbi:MAG: response regulator transcription factor [Cyclobacteriaceae bacterium]
MKVLVVEDNEELARNVNDYLTEEGLLCEVSSRYDDAVDKLISHEYDAIVLDIMLPDGNGLNLLDFIRNQRIDSSVLIISAKNALDDKLKGLNLGADDYLTKPFHLPELNARLKAIYRRKSLNNSNAIVLNEIELDTSTMTANVNRQALDLTRKEFDLLLYFLTNQNRVLTRQSIAEHLWGDHADNLPNYDFVYQHVKNLRKKIHEAGGSDYIETVYGLGYKLNSRKS